MFLTFWLIFGIISYYICRTLVLLVQDIAEQSFNHQHKISLHPITILDILICPVLMWVPPLLIVACLMLGISIMFTFGWEFITKPINSFFRKD